jgi:hypothetical protein
MGIAKVWIPTSALLLGFAMTFSVANPAHAADKPGKLLRHIVLYKFKDSVQPAQVQEVVDAFKALPGKIDTVAGLEAGTNVSEEGKSEGLTHCFVVTFRDLAGRDAYIKHPAHLAYVDIVRDRREKVVVFDFWADE